jgi:hypothetical protein
MRSNFTRSLDTSVSYTAYSNMLQTWLVPQLREGGLEATVLLQEHGVQPHYALQVGNILTTNSVDDGLDVDMI